MADTPEALAKKEAHMKAVAAAAQQVANQLPMLITLSKEAETALTQAMQVIKD